MELKVREWRPEDNEKIVSYFLDASDDYILKLGAEKKKFPGRLNWLAKLENEWIKPIPKKEFYYMIWLLDGEAIGHSNINNIIFGKTAVMHLHIWNPQRRMKGMGPKFLKKSLPYYFEKFDLEVIVCEPYAENIAPSKTLERVGFEFVKSYETTPGWINFHQEVRRYEMTRSRFMQVSS